MGVLNNGKVHRILEDENVHLERYHAHDKENVDRHGMKAKRF